VLLFATIQGETHMVNDTLLEQFIRDFYGYGNFDAPYWFVGMEEGMRKISSSKKLGKKLNKKLNAWDERGRMPLQDLPEFSSALGGKKFFSEKPRSVRTWSRIIHVLFGIKDEATHKPSQIKAYQREFLARAQDGDSCLMELLPLAAYDTNVWPPYKKISNIPCLKSRDIYVQQVRPNRIADLKRYIETYHPQVAVMYGKGNWNHYAEIAGVEFHGTEMHDVKIGKNEKTLFVLTRHMAVRNLTNKECYAIGQMIRSQLM
jgi:hypothetical protein